MPRKAELQITIEFAGKAIRLNTPDYLANDLRWERSEEIVALFVDALDRLGEKVGAHDRFVENMRETRAALGDDKVFAEEVIARLSPGDLARLDAAGVTKNI